MATVCNTMHHTASAALMASEKWASFSTITRRRPLMFYCIHYYVNENAYLLRDRADVLKVRS